jgi:trehalose/maltose transport system permease protein
MIRQRSAPPRPMSSLVNRVVFYVLVAVVLVYLIFPLYWALTSSLKEEAELIQTPTTYWPTVLSFKNYEAVLSNPQIIKGLLNSTAIGLSVVALSLLFGSFAAFALGRLRFHGKRAVLYIILSMTLFPQIAVLPGLFKVVQDFGLYGNITGLITTYLVFTLPLTTWVLMTFYQSLPDEIEEAAFVDGATWFQTFRIIMLPLTVPAMVTTGLLAFIGSWNEYLYAISLTVTNPNAQPVTVAMANFRGTASAEPFGQIMAATVLITIPLLIIVFVFQHRIVTGLTAGAVKS